MPPESFDAKAAAEELRQLSTSRQVSAFRERLTAEQRKAAFALLTPMERGVVTLLWRFGPQKKQGRWSSWEDSESTLVQLDE
jgi:hypothetical protein